MKSFLILLTLTFWTSLAHAETLRIVADITPVSAIARQIAGPDHEVKALITDNASAHDFALRPSDIKALQAADLILWTGADATPALEKLLTSPAFIDKVRNLSELEGIKLLPLRKAGDHDDNHEGGHDDSHEIGHEDEHEEGHQEEGHDDSHGDTHGAHSGVHNDPHLWLSPANGLLWADAITSDLSALNPADTTGLQIRRDKIRTEIEAALDQAKTSFARAPRRPYIQYHDAFAYFEDALGLTPTGIATSDDEEHASLGKIAALRSLAAAQTSICVMISHPMQERVAKTLLVANESRLVLANPIKAPSYPALLNRLIESYRTCLY